LCCFRRENEAGLIDSDVALESTFKMEELQPTGKTTWSKRIAKERWMK
jgi:Txe/YoeB family toxin of Txe-Axe toxin-antitoxin module